MKVFSIAVVLLASVTFDMRQTPKPHAAVGEVAACLDSEDKTFQWYREAYEAMVSDPDTVFANQRVALNLPTLNPSDVRMIADTAICRAASIAYDKEINQSHPNVPVIVLQLGPARRVVIKDIGWESLSLNILFNADFSTVVERIWY